MIRSQKLKLNYTSSCWRSSQQWMRFRHFILLMTWQKNLESPFFLCENLLSCWHFPLSVHCLFYFSNVEQYPFFRPLRLYNPEMRRTQIALVKCRCLLATENWFPTVRINFPSLFFLFLLLGEILFFNVTVKCVLDHQHFFFHYLIA